MKLNWDIVRSILLSLEKSTTAEAAVTFNNFPAYDPQEVGYHMELLAESSFVILLGGRVVHSGAKGGAILMAGVCRLTIAGHELLDTLRNDTVWEAVKKRFNEAGLAMSLAAVGKVAEKVTESLLGLSS